MLAKLQVEHTAPYLEIFYGALKKRFCQNLLKEQASGLKNYWSFLSEMISGLFEVYDPPLETFEV